MHTHTNRQEPTLDHLREALRTLSSEQQELALRAACSTSSLNRLNKRVLLFERLLVALSRKEEAGLGEAGEMGEMGDREETEEEEEQEKMDRERDRETEGEKCVL